MEDRRDEFSFSLCIHVKIDISIPIIPMITKFGKKVHLQDFIQLRLIKQVLVTSLRQDHMTN